MHTQIQGGLKEQYDDSIRQKNNLISKLEKENKELKKYKEQMIASTTELKEANKKVD